MTIQELYDALDQCEIEYEKIRNEFHIITLEDMDAVKALITRKCDLCMAVNLYEGMIQEIQAKESEEADWMYEQEREELARQQEEEKEPEMSDEEAEAYADWLDKENEREAREEQRIQDEYDDYCAETAEQYYTDPNNIFNPITGVEYEDDDVLLGKHLTRGDVKKILGQ